MQYMYTSIKISWILSTDQYNISERQRFTGELDRSQRRIILEKDNAENELSSVFKAYSNPVDQYTHLPPRVSEGACWECSV